MSDPTEGDRVIVGEHIAQPEHQRATYPDAVGMHGIITENDGWGLCTVALDDGTTIKAWNGADLERE
jgi:hypothetical protein